MRKVGAKFLRIGELLCVNPDTVRAVWNQYEETGTCENAPRTGRPTKLSDRDRREVKRFMKKDRDTRREPLSELILDLNLSCSERTLKKEIENFSLGH